MITLYELEGVRHGAFEIVPIECDRATKDSIWPTDPRKGAARSGRRSRDCYYRIVFDTEQEARDHALKVASSELAEAEISLRKARERVALAKALNNASGELRQQETGK